ncbi:hypothetical protein [Lysinibacillus sp. CTST325]
MSPQKFSEDIPIAPQIVIHPLWYIILKKGGVKITKKIFISSPLPYLLLVLSIFLLFLKSNFVLWSILAFVLTTINLIDKKNENQDEKELILAKKG